MIRALRHGEAPPEGIEPRRYRNSHGYIRLRWIVAPGELVECYEHRWVMGNPPADVHVHHKNHVRDDNRPENLEILTPAQHGAEHAEIDVDEATRLYLSGMSTPEVGRVLGFDASAIYRALVRSGVTPRNLSESQRADLPDDEVRRLHQAGVSARMIAQHLGVSPSLIHVRVKELGLTPHRPGRQTTEQIARARAALREAS